MNRLPKDVAGVDSKPPIASANSATSGKRTSNEAAASGTSVKHKFSRSLARRLAAGKTGNRAQEEAINLATLLFRLCWLISKREARQKPWYAATLKTLTKRLVPYFSTSGVHTMLERLKSLGYVLSDDKQNPTRYFITKKAKAEAMDDLIWFDPIVAQQYGSITLAALLHNLTFHLRMERSVNAKDQPFFALSPRELSKTLPFSESSLKRAKTKLLDYKFVTLHPNDKALYSIPNWRLLEPLQGSVSEKTKAVLGSMAEKRGSMAEKRGSVSEMRGSMADETQRRVDPGKIDRKKKESEGKAPPLSPVQSGSAGGDATAKSQGDSAHDAGTQQKENGSSPEFISFDQLQELNRANEKVISTFAGDVIEDHKDAVEHICNSLLEGLSAKTLFELSAAKTKDELSNAFVTFVQAKITQTAENPFEGLTLDVTHPIYFHAVLEILTLSFYRAIHPKAVAKTSITIHQKIADSTLKRATRVLVDAKRSGSLWRDINSANAGKAVAPLFQHQLQVQEKVELFQSTVAGWNRTGWMFEDGKYRYNLITCVDKDSELIKELFTSNPELSVGELLVVLNECIDVQREQETPAEDERDQFWHARRVDSVWFFARKLGPILKQLGWTDDLPITTFLE